MSKRLPIKYHHYHHMVITKLEWQILVAYLKDQLLLDQLRPHNLYASAKDIQQRKTAGISQRFLALRLEFKCTEIKSESMPVMFLQMWLNLLLHQMTYKMNLSHVLSTLAISRKLAFCKPISFHITMHHLYKLIYFPDYRSLLVVSVTLNSE